MNNIINMGNIGDNNLKSKGVEASKNIIVVNKMEL
jgi:hypothetical protein